MGAGQSAVTTIETQSLTPSRLSIWKIIIVLCYTALAVFTWAHFFTAFNLNYCPFEPRLGFLRNDTLVANCYNSTTSACRTNTFRDNRYTTFTPYVIYASIWTPLVFVPLLVYLFLNSRALFWWAIFGAQVLHALGFALVGVVYVVWWVGCGDYDVCAGPVKDNDITGTVRLKPFPAGADPWFIAHVVIGWAIGLLSWALLLALVRYGFQIQFYKLQMMVQNPVRNAVRGLGFIKDAIDAQPGAVAMEHLLVHAAKTIQANATPLGFDSSQDAAAPSSSSVTAARDFLKPDTSFVSALHREVFGARTKEQ